MVSQMFQVRQFSRIGLDRKFRSRIDTRWAPAQVKYFKNVNFTVKTSNFFPSTIQNCSYTCTPAENEVKYIAKYGPCTKSLEDQPVRPSNESLYCLVPSSGFFAIFPATQHGDCITKLQCTSDFTVRTHTQCRLCLLNN